MQRTTWGYAQRAMLHICANWVKKNIAGLKMGMLCLHRKVEKKC